MVAIARGLFFFCPGRQHHDAVRQRWTELSERGSGRRQNVRLHNSKPRKVVLAVGVVPIFHSSKSLTFSHAADRCIAGSAATLADIIILLPVKVLRKLSFSSRMRSVFRGLLSSSE